MFVSDSSLPHLLKPEGYYTDSQHVAERALLAKSWQLVGTKDELRGPGDFIALELLGHYVQIRNFDNQLVAVSNVCAHRHCLMTHEERGNSPRMKCQYHGWEYGPDGQTRRIPLPKNFVPHKRDLHRLPVYRVETCGQLVFVSLENDGFTLRDQFGEMFDDCALRFGDGWECKLNWNPGYDVNWKIPVENTLEAYHVPYIHPKTFRVDPGEDRSTHLLNDRHTAFGTKLPFSPHSSVDRWFQKWDGWLVRRLGDESTDQYWQHHLFPNVLISFTDSISLIHCVVPTGATTSRGFVRQFSRVGTKPGIRRWFARRWAGLKSAITRKIMLEDLALFEDIQRGLQCSTQTGVLGRCEERIHQFQKYLIESTRGLVDSNASGENSRSGYCGENSAKNEDSNQGNNTRSANI